MNERERLSSRLGFIMLSAGCAIGCGNVWKFPWMCGQNGGGSFMLVYILCLLILGIPAMVMEFSVGRASQVSPIYMYKKLSKSEIGYRKVLKTPSTIADLAASENKLSEHITEALIYKKNEV